MVNGDKKRWQRLKGPQAILAIGTNRPNKEKGWSAAADLIPPMVECRNGQRSLPSSFPLSLLMRAANEGIGRKPSDSDANPRANDASIRKARDVGVDSTLGVLRPVVVYPFHRNDPSGQSQTMGPFYPRG